MVVQSRLAGGWSPGAWMGRLSAGDLPSLLAVDWAYSSCLAPLHMCLQYTDRRCVLWRSTQQRPDRIPVLS